MSRGNVGETHQRYRDIGAGAFIKCTLGTESGLETNTSPLVSESVFQTKIHRIEGQHSFLTSSPFPHLLQSHLKHKVLPVKSGEQ